MRRERITQSSLLSISENYHNGMVENKGKNIETTQKLAIAQKENQWQK